MPISTCGVRMTGPCGKMELAKGVESAGGRPWCARCGHESQVRQEELCVCGEVREGPVSPERGAGSRLAGSREGEMQGRRPLGTVIICFVNHPSVSRGGWFCGKAHRPP